MNPENPEARIRENRPFEGMDIASFEVLDSIKERSICSACKKSRKYFCYTCFLPVEELQGRLPHCALPIKVDIIKHAREIDGKSTAAHAAVLAHNDVKIYTYPEMPDISLDGTTVLLYPGVEAKTVPELFQTKNNSVSYIEKVVAELPSGCNVGTLMKINFAEDNEKTIYHTKVLPIKRVILIDSTWNQSRGIFADEQLQKIPKIVLQNRPSQFWRHQKGSPRWYLSTVEALHQLLLELHMCAWGRSEQYHTELTSQYPVHSTDDHCNPYAGQYDNLLFFFKFMYEKIHTLYNHGDLMAYKRLMNKEIK